MQPTYKWERQAEAWNAPPPPTPFTYAYQPQPRLRPVMQRPSTGRLPARSNNREPLSEMDSFATFASYSTAAGSAVSTPSGGTLFRGQNDRAQGYCRAASSPPRPMRQPSLTRVTSADYVSRRPASAAASRALSCAPCSPPCLPPCSRLRVPSAFFYVAREGGNPRRGCGGGRGHSDASVYERTSRQAH
jgi:hypothetical protein